MLPQYSWRALAPIDPAQTDVAAAESTPLRRAEIQCVTVQSTHSGAHAAPHWRWYIDGSAVFGDTPNLESAKVGHVHGRYILGAESD